jgi:hypothetical protein
MAYVGLGHVEVHGLVLDGGLSLLEDMDAGEVDGRGLDLGERRVDGRPRL